MFASLKSVRLELPHCRNRPGEKVNSHKNAKLTAGGQEEAIRRMHAAPDVEVTIDFGVSIRAARKWMSHYRQGGVESLAGRSSRPGRCRDTFTGENACRMLALRKMRMTGDKTALRPGFCRGGVFRDLRKPDCSRLAFIHWEMPGQMPHETAGSAVEFF